MQVGLPVKSLRLKLTQSKVPAKNQMKPLGASRVYRRRDLRWTYIRHLIMKQ